MPGKNCVMCRMIGLPSDIACRPGARLGFSFVPSLMNTRTQPKPPP